MPSQGLLDLRRARDLQQRSPQEARFQIPEEALLRVFRFEAERQTGEDFQLHLSAHKQCVSATKHWVPSVSLHFTQEDQRADPHGLDERVSASWISGTKPENVGRHSPGGGQSEQVFDILRRHGPRLWPPVLGQQEGECLASGAP